MSEFPKVSCLIPTTNRFELFRRSVGYFCRQTWPNKELVIVSNGSRDYHRQIGKLLDDLGRNDLRFFPLHGEDWNLGKLRNQTLDHATGDFLCQWDDDDMYHPLRVERQVTTLLSRPEAVACLLTEHLQYFYNRNELFWTNWNFNQSWALPRRVIPASVFFHRSFPGRYPETGPHCHCFEDMIFLDQLVAAGPLALLEGEPHLYVYTFHGANVYDYEHHWKIVATYQRARSRQFQLEHREYLERHLNQFDWPQSRLAVCGPDGCAFEFVSKAAQRAA